MNSGPISRRGTMQVFAAAGLAGGGSAQAATGSKQQYLAIYHGLIADWKKKDIDSVLDKLTDDIEWHYLVGSPPVTGKAGARGFLEKFAATIKEVRWRIFDAMAEGDKLMVEGVDEYIAVDGKRIAAPYMGILQFRDGKIYRWRDYTDSGVIAKQRAGEAPPDFIDKLIDRKAI